LPPLDRSRLGASTACLAGRTLLEALDEMSRMGFQTVELIAYTGASHSVGPIPGFDYVAAGEAERERVYSATRTFGHLSSHLPFQDFQLFAGGSPERERGLRQIEDALDGLAYLEGSLGVMHVGWPPEGKTFRDIWRPMIDTLRSLGDYAAGRGLKIPFLPYRPRFGRCES
jgi:sugar phosphate isomerase/epimerase